MAREDGHSTSNPEPHSQSSRGIEHHEQREHHERHQEHEAGASAEPRGVERSSQPTAQFATGGFGRPLLTTAALIGVAALFEPELLAGMAIGAGVALTSSLLPNIVGGTLRPIVKTAIRAGYAAASAAREIASEASESMQDIVAEARMGRGSTE